MKNLILIFSALMGLATLVNASDVTKAGTRIVNGTVVTDRTEFAYQTEENFVWSSTVNYLPIANVTPAAGSECYVSGWGSTSIYEGHSSKLLYAMVPVINKTVCSMGYGNGLLEDGMLCAGYMQGIAGSCHGDHGGPLACDGVVAGVVSWGLLCANPLFPGVYADVAYYKDWIKSQLED